MIETAAAQRFIVLDHGGDTVAIVAVVVSVVAVVVSAVLWWAERRDRVTETSKREQLEAEVANLQAAQADALAGIQRATEAGIDPAAAHRLGAAISFEIVRTDVPVLGAKPYQARAWRHDLHVRNLGPGGAQVRRLTIITSGAGELDESGSGVPGDTQELLPGEGFWVRLILADNHPDPIELSVAWLDGTGVEKERIRALTFPP